MEAGEGRNGDLYDGGRQNGGGKDGGDPAGAPPERPPQIAFARRLRTRREEILRETNLAGGRHPLVPVGELFEPLVLAFEPGIRPESREALWRLHGEGLIRLRPTALRRLMRLRRRGETAGVLSLVVYRAENGRPLDLPDGVRITAIGAPTADLPEKVEPKVPLRRKERRRKSPIVAVIDDGIGFLNRRFCRPHRASGGGQTRFAAVWLQSFESSVFGKGRVLSADQIDALAGLPDEAEVYAGVGRPLADFGRRSTEYRFSHGTHVLDLAAGADPAAADPVSRCIHEWTLLGVQLAPHAVEDTSGKRLEVPILEAVQFILDTAERMNPRRPVIINLSFGVMAGAKDGTGQFPRDIARELDAWRSKGRQVEMVVAFGNGYRTRQVARGELGAAPRSVGTPPAANGLHGWEVDWRLQPESLLPASLEIHLDDPALLPSLAVGLEDPFGVRLPPLPLAEGQVRDISPPSASFGSITRMAPIRDGSGTELTAGFVSIDLGPTSVILPKELSAAPGRWRVRLENGGRTPITFRAEVQRSDTPPGYRPHGRQSTLDHPGAWGWDTELQDHTDPAASPITRLGTQSAYIPSLSPAVSSVGAYVQSSGKPALYTASGGASPTGSAAAEYAPATSGVLASGTFSGTIAASNGTSAAAPQRTRHRAAQAAPGCPVPLQVAPVAPPADQPRLGSTRYLPYGDRPRSRG